MAPPKPVSQRETLDASVTYQSNSSEVAMGRPMKITSITIERFKRIEHVAFDLDAVNILIGGNNSGKSTIIQGVHFAFTLFQSLNIANKWPAKTKRSTTVTPSELIYIPSDDTYSMGFGGRLLEDDDKSIVLTFNFDDGNSVFVKVRKGRITNIIVEPDNVDFARTLSTLSSPYTVFSPGLAGVSRTETYVSDGVLLRALARGDANVVLRNILSRLKDKAEWSAFESDLSEIFPHLRLEISYDPKIDQFIDVTVIENGTSIPLDLAGTGLLQAVQILAYLHLFSPKLIILDEPDSHLHPNNQRLLCSLLSSISIERDVQVLITTHSRHVLDAMYGDANILWVQDGGVKRASPDDQVELLLELGALDIKEKVSSQKYKVLFLTEDRITQFLNRLLWKSGFVESETGILPYNGVTSVHLLKPLIKQIKDLSTATIFVHRDRDYLEPDEIESWKKQIREIGAEPFVTAEMDIEGYFVTDAALQTFANEHAGGNVAEILAHIADGESDDILTSYVNGRIDHERKSGTIGKLDYGALSTAASKKVTANPLAFMKGKRRLSKMRYVAREIYGTSFELTNPTDAGLEKLALKFFKAKE